MKEWRAKQDSNSPNISKNWILPLDIECNGVDQRNFDL